MELDAVLFDCDGVLVDSEPLVNRVYVDLLLRQGHRLDAEATLREFAGASMADRVEAFRRRLAWTPPDGFLDEFHRLLSDLCRRELEAVPFVQELIASLRVPYAVVSNGTPEEMRERLEATKLLASFEGRMFSASEVERPKPHPDVYLHAARGLGVDPARCLAVEDSEPGVRSAIAAGMRVFGYAAHSEAARLEAAGATPFRSMRELVEILR